MIESISLEDKMLLTLDFESCCCLLLHEFGAVWFYKKDRL